MKPLPEKSKDLPYFSQDMDALIDFVSKRWNGIEHLKPKKYKKFCKNYKDFDGMLDPEIQKDIEEYDSFDDSTACSFPFPVRISLAHTAYNEICQSIKPPDTLLGAFFAHGHAAGKLYGKDKTLKSMSIKLSWYLTCKLFPKYKEKLSKAAYEEISKMINEYTNFILEVGEGKHDSICTCEKCKIPFNNSIKSPK